MAEISEALLVERMNSDLHRLAMGLAAALTQGEYATSQERVPVEFEDLKKTGQVSEPFEKDGVWYVVLSYGNPEDDTGIYAIVQEERTDYNHPLGGRAKYLESSVLEGAGTIGQRTANEAGKVIPGETF